MIDFPSEDGTKTPDKELRCSGTTRPSVLAGTSQVSGVRLTAVCLHRQTNGGEKKNGCLFAGPHIGQEVHEEKISMSVF